MMNIENDNFYMSTAQPGYPTNRYDISGFVNIATTSKFGNETSIQQKLLAVITKFFNEERCSAEINDFSIQIIKH